MRGFNSPLKSPGLWLVGEQTRWDKIKAAVGRFRKRVRHLMCVLVHGGHEMYRARTDTKLFHQCLLCGYESHGWTIDRRDRRTSWPPPDVKKVKRG